MKRALVTALLLAVALPVLAQESRIQLRQGPGRAVVQAKCSICHSLDYIPMNSPFLDRKGWQAEVEKMVKVMGCPLNQNEVQQVVDYLTKNYGKK